MLLNKEQFHDWCNKINHFQTILHNQKPKTAEGQTRRRNLTQDFQKTDPNS
jgi:hypothetical protein